MSFTATKWAWRIELPPLQKAVLLALADLANGRFECWPGQRRLAEMTGYTDRSVRSALVELVSRGLVSRETRARSNGSRSSDRYTLHVDLALVPDVTQHGDELTAIDASETTEPEQAFTSEGAEGASGTPSDTPQTPRKELPEGAEGASGGPRKELPGKGTSQKEPTQVNLVNARERASDPEPLDLSLPTPSRSEQHSNENGSAPGFDDFWRAYPRRVGKRAAAAAWGRAVKRAAPETIIAAAEAYAADPNREPAFTAHPTTWLNQDRWDDEPLPARSQRDPRGHDQMMARLAALDAAHTTGQPAGQAAALAAGGWGR